VSALRSCAGGAVRRARTFAHAVRALGARHAALGWRYAAARAFPAGDDRAHLVCTLDWLCRAQDARGDGGVSAQYSLAHGWDVSYPETSGYIAATFLAGADYLGDPRLVERARRICDWEIAIQAPNGGVLSRPGRPETRVFNTGQVVLGWCALSERTGDPRYLAAARRAGDYLLGLQERDGSWQKDTYCGARTYHARTDWGLLRLARLAGDTRYRDAARRNLRWVVAQRQDNGWFRNCGFNADDPITHVIDYTFIGILESALLDPDAFDTAAADLLAPGAAAICDAVERSALEGIPGMIPASFDAHWRSRDEYSCLTGNAQLAYTLLRLHSLAANERYARAARALISALKRTQAREGAPDAVRGAVAGSFPLYQGYLSNSFPNWAAKFFADALLAALRAGGRFAVAA
jgi:hypothetical protein